MNQNIRKLVTKGFEISRKVLCLLLACTLLIQTGCQTTKVLKSIEQEELKAEQHKPLNLKVEQLIRITYLDGSATKSKRQIGRVESVTADAIVIVTSTHGFKDKEVRISFKHINKIELLTKKKASGEQAIAIIVFFPVILFLIWYNRLQFD